MTCKMVFVFATMRSRGGNMISFLKQFQDNIMSTSRLILINGLN